MIVQPQVLKEGDGVSIQGTIIKFKILHCWHKRDRNRHLCSTCFVISCRNDSIYEDFRAGETGTTFVELIKRPGTYLGVVVSDREPKIAQLVPGSWAQRSDVLCVGDRIMSVNGMAAESLSQAMLARNMDESDRIQLEVRYRLPPQPTILGRRKKVVQVSTFFVKQNLLYSLSKCVKILQ